MYKYCFALNFVYNKRVIKMAHSITQALKTADVDQLFIATINTFTYVLKIDVSGRSSYVEYHFNHYQLNLDHNDYCMLVALA